MNKKIINNTQYNFIQLELRYYKDNGIITDEQMKSILDLYEVKQGLNFIRVLVLIGSVLVGLGVLSFIASNWAILSNLSKLAIILTFFLGSNFTSYKLSHNYPKTSKSLLYVGIITYGAGIFLIGQMFNFGGHFTSAFLLWAVGIFPMAFIFKDQLIFIFTDILVLIYINGYFDLDKIPIAIFAIIPVLLYCNKYFNFSPVITFLNNLIVINTLGYFLSWYNVEPVLICLIFFFLGLVMLYYPVKINKNIFELQGNLLLGISGIILTISEVWNNWDFVSKGFTADIISIIFAALYLIFLLSLTRKENLIALTFICITIFRYYIDTMYDFLPKSLFFISGGFLLLGFGFYIEKMRNKRRGINSAK